MKKVLRFLKRIWLLQFIRRVYHASKYFNKKYFEILKWGFQSREDTNYTYDLTETNIIYLSQIIAHITGKDIKLILEYIEEARNDQELKEHIIKETLKSYFKNRADLEVHFGRRLGWYAFVRIMKPQIVVETGVDKGLGAVLLCAGLLKNKGEGFSGRYYGTEINPNGGYLLKGKYQEIGRILYGDSIGSLSKFNETIDLFINDSDHSTTYEYKEYLTIKDKITDKSILLGDNSHCTDKLSVFSIETDRDFLFFQEQPKNHWYPGGGIGISFKRNVKI
jgi:predicted O-methyltransferase YrrM